MKLNELKMEDWNGTYRKITSINGLDILLLSLNNFLTLKEDGRRNLLGVDKDFNIVWFAEPPKMARTIGYFIDVEYINNILDGWYGGDVHVIIDPMTGKLLKEEFIK